MTRISTDLHKCPGSPQAVPRCGLLFILLLIATVALGQETTLSGKVMDSGNGKPLSYATLVVKGTVDATTTNAEGEFTLRTGASLPLTLSVTAVGFGQLDIVANSSEPLVISLEESTTTLSEVVISSGYNVQKKESFSGSVATVSSKQLMNRPTVSFDQLLGGQAAGVDIIQPTNILNNTPVMRVRGINSITSGLFPLVVVDGVTMFVGSVGGLVGNNPLSDINPNDIQTIDVLKDASAGAIYGSRAANGVIVITTKKGKPGKTKVDYDMWISRSTPYNLPDLLSAEDYMMIKNEALVNAGKEPGYFPTLNEDGSTLNTNWYDVGFKPGFSQSHNVSVSGGTETTSYFFSAGYTNQDSYIRNNSYERTGVRFNIDQKVTKKITIGGNVTYSNGMNIGTNTGAIPANSMGPSTYNTEYITNEPLARMTYVLPPNVPVYRPDGSYSIQNGVSVGYGANIPAIIGTINAYNLAMVQTLDLNSSENNTLFGNVYGEVEILRNLKFRTSYGINNLQVQNKSFFNSVHGGGASSNGISRNTHSKFYRTDWVSTLSYNLSLAGGHNIYALGGYEIIKTLSDGWGASESNVTDPDYSNYQGRYTNIAPFGNFYSENALLSYFANVNYDFNKKYLISFNFRRDGLSALAEGNKYGNFGGVALGWNVHEESFFRDSFLSGIIGTLKVRGSYGIVGNSEIGDYPAAGMYSSNTYGGVPTLGFSQAANPDLKWETSKKTDIGVDFTVWNDRIALSFDYYKNDVNDLILKAPQSLSAGIPGNYINSNVGSLYNQGVELGINAVLINKADFQWNAGLNISTLKNRVTSLVSDVFVPSVFGVQNMTRVGYSIGSIFAVPCNGVNPENGQMIFVNHDGREVQYNHIGSPKWTYVSDGKEAPAIDNYTDGVMQGPSLPKVFGGFNNTLLYKGFDLNFNFTFVTGNLLYNGTRATNSDQRYFNNGEFIMDRWTTPGQITDIQKLYYGDNVSAGFSFSATSKVEKGDYVKLKNISLGYTIPFARTFLAGKISNAHVFIQGSNVFTITRYRGSDPEVSINGNSIHSGKDQNVPPNAQVVTVGLNLGI
ncbi:MAG: SusC/RagA family TonB-linked outer membrane protein [Chryseolinea sp.]